MGGQRLLGLALGLAVLAGVGLMARGPGPAAPPAAPSVADTPACGSCDARHARLAELRMQVKAGAE